MSRITYITSLLEDLNKYTPKNNQRNATAATLDPKALAIDLATTTLTDITDSDFGMLTSSGNVAAICFVLNVLPYRLCYLTVIPT
jgi:hypothetical protein